MANIGVFATILDAAGQLLLVRQNYADRLWTQPGGRPHAEAHVLVRAGERARGQTMIIVEQSLNVALAISDRAIFLEKGEVKFEGDAQELLERDDLARAVFFGNEGG